LLKRYESADGKRWLELYKRADGFFCFQEFFEDAEDLHQFGHGALTFESPGWQSGLYVSAEAAEEEARKMTTWLRLSSD
jgi:hypothetical protein